jgi:hypothetical protein
MTYKEMISIATGAAMIHYAAICWEREYWERGRPRPHLEVGFSFTPSFSWVTMLLTRHYQPFNGFTFEETVETVALKSWVITTRLKPGVNETDSL